jgi:RNA polymerase sigma-70 factor (ECF subfamily)
MDRAERFSDLYRAQYAAVLRYASRRTDPETARDVVADTFLVAWRRMGKVPADPSHAGPWLFGVARLVLANAERSRRRAGRVTARLGQQRLADHAPDTAGVVTERAILERALAGLSSSDQEALKLIGWEELNLAEAAQAMGCSRAAMAVRLHRARRRLERALTAADREDSAPAVGGGTPGQQVTQETS